ncbi:unnamed protein product [Hyaloperonospora brassicae]|uniref:PH domain-containing protein n=1 Tax=Hyaloperonospora brassicae TaxID=162125 RepID=A0AAV0TUI6_HYABA|nr:unnamed protein product [Hyaloperonospora brassicae]
MVLSFPPRTHAARSLARAPFYPSKARGRPPPTTTFGPSGSLYEPFLSSPVFKSSRSESLRSTWMTTDSDSVVGRDDDDDDDESDSATANDVVGSHRIGQSVDVGHAVVPLRPPQPLSDWVYWQRDAVALPNCWTRVFAVFSRPDLWLYRYEDASARSLLVRLRVTALDVVSDARQLQFHDAGATACVQLCFPDAAAVDRWVDGVTSALVARAEPTHATSQTAVLSTKQQKSFWAAVRATVRDVTTKQQVSAGQADPAFGRARCQPLKQLGQQWKQVTSALKGALRPQQLRRRRQFRQLGV